ADFARPISRGSMTTNEGGNTRVLVVDDQPAIVNALRHIFAADGYQVRTALDGRTALANMREWRPGLVTTDLGTDERPRALQSDPGGVERAHHRRLGRGRRAVEGRGARFRCRRLPREAVRSQ